MDIGRKQIGDTISLQLICVNADDESETPDVSPTVAVFSADGTLLVEQQMPPVRGSSSVFVLRVPLDARFEVGHHFAYYQWELPGGFEGRRIDHFQIVPGGDSDGIIIAGVWTTMPHVRHIIFQTDTGMYFKGGNPTVLMN